MERNKLLKSREYWLTGVQIEVYGLLENYMKSHNMNKTDLAKHLNFSKGYISQILKGDFNYKISTLIDLSLSLGKAPIIKFEDLNTYIEKDELGIYKFPDEFHNTSVTLNIVLNSDTTSNTSRISEVKVHSNTDKATLGAV